jgi:4-amino-4-deoxy-L-arabinose transferase-like glycosyltransferase
MGHSEGLWTAGSARLKASVTADPWRWLMAGSVVLALAIYLAGLARAPATMSADEASSAYNAWAIGHYGVDEYGRAFPLYFEAFHDWHSPLYYYLLAPLTRVLPLTAYVVRLPAAFCGLGICALAALTAHRLTGSRAVAALTLLTAVVMPWLVMESRFAVDTITQTLCVTAAVYCLVRAETRGGWRWFLAGGCALALAIFGYATGRLEVALLMGGLVLIHLPRPRAAGWWLALVPAIPAYGLLGLWQIGHPGALTDRFTSISIFGGGASPLEALVRFTGNLFIHFGPVFLLLIGDLNMRQGTGFGGVLLLASAPAILFGVVACWRHRGDVLARFALVGILLAPIPADMTREGIPHAARTATMVPFFLLLAGYGWCELLPVLTQRPRAARILAGVALAQAALYFGDLYITYPLRAERLFDAGIADAVVRAHDEPGGHRVLLGRDLDQPYIQVLTALRPDPRGSLDGTLARLQISQGKTGNAFTGAKPNDVVVAPPWNRAPRGATLLFDETQNGPWPWSAPVVVADVYRVSAARPS